MGLGTQYSQISLVTHIFKSRNLIKMIAQFYACEMIIKYVNTTISMTHLTLKKT